jgi:hypothetical protein
VTLALSELITDVNNLVTLAIAELITDVNKPMTLIVDRVSITL